MLREMLTRHSPSAGSRPVAIGSRSIGVSLQPAIPRRVAPQQSPFPLHRSPSTVAQSRSAEAIKSLLNRTAGMQSRSRSSCPPPTRVPSLFCAPGVISILRQHACQGENAAARSGRAVGREIEAVSHSAGSLFHSRQPGNGRARGTSMARPQHAVHIVQAVRAGIGLQ
jgi:hypothetical protein